MPTYDYHCDACGHELEIFHSMKDAPKRKCPACGKLKLVRRIGAGGGVIFKGSGFYETDYRSDSYKQAAKADSESTAKKETGSTESPSKDAPAPGPKKNPESKPE